MNKSEYQTYLASREWALKREAVRQRAGNKCERCIVGPCDQVHHLTYERIGAEKLEDLQALCVGCHEFLSGKPRSLDPKSLAEHEAIILLERLLNTEELVVERVKKYFYRQERVRQLRELIAERKGA